LTALPRRRPSTPRWGTVAAFDVDRGLGTVTTDDGHPVPFHCTAIVDGSRTVDVGARVVVTLGRGHRGRVEARTVEPLP